MGETSTGRERPTDIRHTCRTETRKRDRLRQTSLVTRRSAALRSVAGVLAVCSIVFGFLPNAGAAPANPAEAASAGAGWTSTQLEAQIPLDLFGSPDWGVTIDAATALAAVDGTNPLIGQVWAQLVTNRDAVVSDGAADVPGMLAKIILLAHATGHDPRAVGEGGGADLVARLQATLQPSGLFGTQFAAYDGVYRQGLAIAALISAGVTPDPSAISWLMDQQCTNAGFVGAYMPFRADTTVECADDPDSWSGADTNAAAMAVTALTYAAPDDSTAQSTIAAALDWLEGFRDTQGGWASNSWSGPDANSTAVVVQALITAGQLDSDRFSSGVRTPQQYLMTLQITEAEEAGDIGAFNYMAGPDDPNLLATVQTIVALASKGLIFDAPMPTDPGEDPSTTTTTVPTDGDTDRTGTASPTTDGTGNSTQGVTATPTDRNIQFAG